MCKSSSYRRLAGKQKYPGINLPWEREPPGHMKYSRQMAGATFSRTLSMESQVRTEGCLWERKYLGDANSQCCYIMPT